MLVARRTRVTSYKSQGLVPVEVDNGDKIESVGRRLLLYLVQPLFCQSDAAKSDWTSLLWRKKRAARFAGGRLFGGVKSALCYERLNSTMGGDEFKRSVAARAVSWRIG